MHNLNVAIVDCSYMFRLCTIVSSRLDTTCIRNEIVLHFVVIGWDLGLKKVIYTGCPRRNGPNFGRVFLMLNYTDITQNTYVQS